MRVFEVTHYPQLTTIANEVFEVNYYPQLTTIANNFRDRKEG